MISSTILYVSTVCSIGFTASAFDATTLFQPKTAVKDVQSKMPMFEYLKFDKTPNFNVLAKTEQYVATQTVGNMSEDWYADDCKFVHLGIIIYMNDI